MLTFEEAKLRVRERINVVSGGKLVEAHRAMGDPYASRSDEMYVDPPSDGAPSVRFS